MLLSSQIGCLCDTPNLCVCMRLQWTSLSMSLHKSLRELGVGGTMVLVYPHQPQQPGSCCEFLQSWGRQFSIDNVVKSKSRIYSFPPNYPFTSVSRHSRPHNTTASLTPHPNSWWTSIFSGGLLICHFSRSHLEEGNQEPYNKNHMIILWKWYSFPYHDLP